MSVCSSRGLVCQERPVPFPKLFHCFYLAANIVFKRCLSKVDFSSDTKPFNRKAFLINRMIPLCTICYVYVICLAMVIHKSPIDPKCSGTSLWFTHEVYIQSAYPRQIYVIQYSFIFLKQMQRWWKQGILHETLKHFIVC